MLEIIYGKSGSGKTQYCFDDVKNKIKENKKIYIITPEQFSFTAEKKLMETVENEALVNVEVLTFERMAYRILNEIGGGSKTTLSNCGKSMMIFDILHKNLKNLKFLNKSDENTQVISNAITELKKHNITVEDLKNGLETTKDEYLKIKLKDIITVYEDYNLKIQNNYIDENDLLTMLLQKIKYTHEYDNAQIYIDEFAGFTKQEFSIIGSLLDVADLKITICTDNLEESINPDADIFYDNKKTVETLLKIASKKNIKLESINLSKLKRFKNEELKHLEENLYSISYKKYEKDVKNINIFLANNEYSEIEYIAQMIIKKVLNDDNLTYNDFAVITKNLSTYGSLIKVIFRKYNIPFFMDEKKDLNQNLVIKYVLSILDVYNKNWSYEAMFNYIKSGFLNLDDDEIFKLENYCLNWGIKKSKWKQDFTYGVTDDETKAYVDSLNELRKQIVEPLQKLKEDIVKEKTAINITKKIYEFLTLNQIDKKLNEKAQKIERLGFIEMAKEYKSGWNILINILDELVLVFNNDKLSINEYTKILKVGIKNSKLGKIPATQDQVIIGNVDRSRSHKVKNVFIIGLNDGEFPTIHKEEGFINDEDRKLLNNQGIELAKTTIDKLYEENFNIYKAFTIAEENLYLSYSSSDIEGKSLRPSILISKIKKIFPKIEEKSDILQKDNEILTVNTTFQKLLDNINMFLQGKQIDKIWFEIFEFYNSNDEWKEKLDSSIKGINYTNNPEKISKDLIDKLYGNTLKTSVSKLETYKSCPFSFHLKYGLKLKEKKEFKLHLIDTGSFMHEVIDEFFNQLIEKNLKPKEIEEEELKQIVNEIIDEKLHLSKNYMFTCTPKFRAQTNMLKRVIIKSIEYIIDEMKMSDFEIIGNEVEFKENSKYKPIKISLENGKNVEITGKIDRIDLAKVDNKNYVRIIDYKSSIKDINLNEVVAGLQIQLLTYLDATCKLEDIMPAGVLYYNLIDGMVTAKKKMTEEEIKQELKKQFKMKGLILADIKIVKMMDNTLDKGTSGIIPAGIDKDGNLKQNKSNINKEQFEKLQKYTKKIIKQISQDILSGNIELKPYYKVYNKKTPCNYCAYKSICGFTKGFCGNNYNYIYNLSKDEIFDKI